MTPRWADYLAQASTRLAAGDAARRDGYPFMVVGAAYYAMLYAARAALSEEELHAKTHRGVWGLLRRELVVGRSSRTSSCAAERARELREAADYEAAAVTDAQAAAALADAPRFVAAVESLLDG